MSKQQYQSDDESTPLVSAIPMTRSRKVRRITPRTIPGTPDEDLCLDCIEFKRQTCGNDFFLTDDKGKTLMGTGPEPSPAYMTMHTRLYQPITALFRPIDNLPITDENLPITVPAPKPVIEKKTSLAFRAQTQQIRNLKRTNQLLHYEYIKITGECASLIENQKRLIKNLEKARADYEIEGHLHEQALEDIENLKKKLRESNTTDLTGEDDVVFVN
jgi:UDP-2,3-diacylglucosamine pyrophosphatase LpxH